jgi:GNAT superfamily N-acetyltransferase
LLELAKQSSIKNQLTTFKPLENHDINSITSMMHDFYAIDNYPIDIDVTKKLFEEFIKNKNLGKAFLICHSDEGRISEIVGYAIITYIFSFEYKGKMAFFEELFINENFRGKGIGQKAIEFVTEFVKNKNIKMMYLEVENHNLNAQKLYLANDFVIHNRKIMKLKLD